MAVMHPRVAWPTCALEKKPSRKCKYRERKWNGQSGFSGAASTRQRQPCVREVPRAFGSVLLTGRAKLTSARSGMSVTSATTAAASSMPRQSHQHPTTRRAIGNNGPSGGERTRSSTSGQTTMGARSSKGKLCLSEDGPMPRVTERVQSVMACSAAASMGVPSLRRCSCLAREKYCSGPL